MNNLIRRINEANGILIIEMRELRNIVGKKKLGDNVRAKIADYLDEAGVGHSKLWNDQDKIVLLYINDGQTKDLLLSATDQILDR